jgi:hypothetical protein
MSSSTGGWDGVPPTIEPTVTCRLCKRRQVVNPDGRGFPPDIAKRKLRKVCQAAGCPCEPIYRAGVRL